jgi:hypothetical protein
VLVVALVAAVAVGAAVLSLIATRATGSNESELQVAGPVASPPVTGVPFEVSITSGGGLTLWGSYMRSIPIRVVDGVLYTASPAQTATYPGPALQPISQQRLTADEVTLLRTQLTEAGLLQTPIDFGLPTVTDNATTHIVIRDGDATYHHAIYALEFGDDASQMGVTKEQFASRTKARKLLGESVLNGTAATEPYTGDRLVIIAQRLADDDVDRQTSTPAQIPWPGPDVLTGSSVPCLELSTQDSTAVIAAMEKVPEDTIWTTSDAKWEVSGHVLTPGETPCAQ